MQRFRANVTQVNSQVESTDIVYRPVKQIKCRAISINQISIPNVFENINQYYNKIKVSYNGGAVTTITIPEGQYTIDRLMTTLEDLLATAFPAAAITITLLENGLLRFEDVNDAPILFELFTSQNYQNQVYRYLGFSNENEIFTTASAQFDGDEYPNVQVSSCINIHLNNIPTNDLQLTSFLVGIPLDEEFGEIISWYNQQTSENKLILEGEDLIISSLVISLRDDFGNKLNVGKRSFNTVPFSFQFCFEY